MQLVRLVVFLIFPFVQPAQAQGLGGLNLDPDSKAVMQQQESLFLEFCRVISGYGQTPCARTQRRVYREFSETRSRYLAFLELRVLLQTDQDILSLKQYFDDRGCPSLHRPQLAQDISRHHLASAVQMQSLDAAGIMVEDYLEWAGRDRVQNMREAMLSPVSAVRSAYAEVEMCRGRMQEAGVFPKGDSPDSRSAYCNACHRQVRDTFTHDE